MLQFIFAIVFYIIATLIVFWQPLINKFGSIQWDAVNVHFFNLFFSSETWNKGIFPLWSPYIFAGFPQIADLQVAFFYPVNFFISALAIFTPELIMYQIILHYFLAGIFTFLLARYLSKNFWFSIAAGIIYSFGGFMAGHASHVGMQNTAAWLPLIFLFLIIALKETKIFYAAFSGLFLGIAILAGHFQTALYIAYAIVFYSVFDILWTTAGYLKTIDKKFINSVWQKFQLVSIIFIIAFLVSAVQLLPTYELTQQSNRAKITLEMSQTESLNPLSLQSLIEPNYQNAAFGAHYLGPWDRTQNYLFIGIAIIILAALGTIMGIFYRHTRKITFFWLTLMIISLLYSFGEFGFLQKYFYRFLPFFDKIRAPANMMLLFNFSIIGLASSFFRNIDHFLEKNDKTSLATHFKGEADSFLIVQGDSGVPLYSPRFVESKRAIKNNRRALYYEKILKFLKNKLSLSNLPALLGIIALLIISMEILPAIKSNTLLYSRQNTNEVIAAPIITRRIEEEYSRLDEISKFKIFKVPGFKTNLTQMRHIFAFDGYNPLSLRRHANYTDAMVKNANLIDLTGIKYLPCEFIPDRADSLEKIDAVCVNKNYFDFAFLVDDYMIAKNETEVLQKIQEIDLNKTIVLEENPEQKNNNKNYSKNDLTEKNEKISIVDFLPGFWRLAINTNKNSFLFVNQVNYPGWNAKIDGIAAKIYQADYLFQAIYVPSGKHEITLKYKSKPLIIGAILTIIGLSLILLISLYTFIKK